MREILFRGKAIKDINSDLTVNTQWVYGYYAKIKPCTGIYGKKEEYIEEEISKIISGQESVTVNQNTVGQYTGLKDKNGKKIFEGDILKEPDVIHKGELQIQGDVFQVLFLEGTFWIVIDNYAKNLLRVAQKKYEVIGNIYDNPELLKDVENEFTCI